MRMAAGVVGEDESAMDGTVTIGTSSASVFLPSYDVNGDGTVDIIDITEAQRYYQADINGCKLGTKKRRQWTSTATTRLTFRTT